MYMLLSNSWRITVSVSQFTAAAVSVTAVVVVCMVSALICQPGLVRSVTFQASRLKRPPDVGKVTGIYEHQVQYSPWSPHRYHPGTALSEKHTHTFKIFIQFFGY